MSVEEQVVALQCLALLDDGNPRALEFVQLPSGTIFDTVPLDGVVQCHTCSRDGAPCLLQQMDVTAHIQGHDLWAPSAHRRQRHEEAPLSAPPRPSAEEGYLEETLEDGLRRLQRTMDLRRLGPFVALEGGERVYCEACRAVVYMPDTPWLLRHKQNPAHQAAVRTCSLLDWTEAPTCTSAGEAPAFEALAAERKLDTNLRKRLGRATRALPEQQLFGASIAYVRQHLERLWQPGMCWATYGSWHVDHIVPVTAYDKNNPVHCMAMCHWSNLQPLWGHDNLAKGGTLAPKE